MTAQCAAIAEQLRQAGAQGEAVKLSPENVPGDDIEALLGEMNFVSQYGAVRAAHLSMRAEGASLEWLGVLVRGYAHLAMLSEHLWSSQHEAFAARSLLYAERMVKLAEGDALALWHRAYARAAIGMHGAAIDQLEAIARAGDEVVEAKEDKLPAWTKLIKPYVEFDRDAIEAVREEHGKLAETAAVMIWEIDRSYLHGRWIYEKGIEAMRAVPEAYGTYSVMANWSALKISRMGSAYGSRVFAERLPIRMGLLPRLPEAAREHTAQEKGILDAWLGRRSQGPIDRPAKIARALTAATLAETEPTECSWSMLGALIAEHQFVVVADVLEVSGNAVEHSNEELVDYIHPLVAGHRYEAYLRKFAFPLGEQERAEEVVRDLRFVDPRGNMQPMFYRLWHVAMAGLNGNDAMWRALWGRNFTQQGMLESYQRVLLNWSKVNTPENRAKFAGDFAAISPHWPQARRMAWGDVDSKDKEQVAAWEAKLGEDPIAWLALGNHYYEANDLSSAQRCYQRSIQISPSMDAVEGLANAYWHDGKEELWQPTLETYLELEDLSLSHAEVHMKIARWNMQHRAWAKAESHAVEAAETYSGAGLMLAAHLYEGMQDWERSEHYVSEATRSYPSYSTGTDWYFWCRRTGRGDELEALKFAKRSIEIARTSTHPYETDRVFFYLILEDEWEKALAYIDETRAKYVEPEATWDKAWRLFHIAALAGRMKDEARRDATLAELRAFAEAEFKEQWPNWIEIFEGLCQAFEGNEPDEKFLKLYRETLAGGDGYYRVNYSYFMGEALDMHGHGDLAEGFWRTAAFGGPYDILNSTLAGARLVERLGRDRGGIPEELAKQEAAAKAEAGEAESEDPPAGADDQTI
jgi:tetratricopeptide (TPR) repeat protein